MLYKTNPDNFIAATETIKALAHPQRLCIVKTLCERDEASVTEMQGCLDEAQSKVSQHLARLKAANIVVGKRKGNKIYYSLSDKKVLAVMGPIIQQYLTEPL